MWVVFVERPYVILNSAMSLDGRVGRRDGQIVFTNRLENYRVEQLRGGVDAIMVDVDTIFADNPELKAGREGRRPAKVIVDTHADVPHDALALADTDVQVIVATSADVSSRKTGGLASLGRHVRVVSVGAREVDLGGLLSNLYERGIRTVLLEGSRELTRAMLDMGLVDEIYLTVVPTVIGDGINFVEGSISRDVELELEGILQYGNQVVLHYIVKA